MGTLTTSKLTKVQTAQAAFGAAKQALRDLRSAANALCTEFRQEGTTEALIASNAAMILEGQAEAILGKIKQAHGQASIALIAYDAAGSGPVIQGGGGGR